jgi:hypothetical protein
VRAFSATVKGIKATPRASQLNPPAFFDNKERIIYSVVWATNNEVKEILYFKQGDRFLLLFNNASSAAPQVSRRSECAGTHAGLLRLWH